MNFYVVLGFSIVVLAIVFDVWAIASKKFASGGKKALAILVTVVVAFAGIGVAQYGSMEHTRTINDKELALLESGKSYTEFTEDERVTMIELGNKLIHNPELTKPYEEIIIGWRIEMYAAENSHRTDLTEERIREFVLKDIETKRNSK